MGELRINTAKHPTVCFYLDTLVNLGLPGEPMRDLLAALDLTSDACDTLEEVLQRPAPETFEEAFVRLEKRGPKSKADTLEKRAHMAVKRAQRQYDKRFSIPPDVQPLLEDLRKTLLAADSVAAGALLTTALNDAHQLVVAVGGKRFGAWIEQCIYMAADIMDLRGLVQLKTRELQVADPARKKRVRETRDGVNAVLAICIQKSQAYVHDMGAPVPSPAGMEDVDA